MKRQAVKNNEIKHIGEKVLTAARLSAEEAGRIADAPGLFRQVRAAAEAEKLRAVYARPVKAGVFRKVRLQYVLSVFVGVITVTVAFALLYFTSQNGTDHSATIAQTSAASEKTSVIPERSGISDPATTAKVPTQPVVPVHNVETRQATIKLPADRTARRPAKRSLNSKRNEEMGEFQALTYAGGPDETDEVRQIVRVQLSRASLFAMGVDIPVGNETEKVKADLLIGFDGVMRGVRLEKNIQE